MIQPDTQTPVIRLPFIPAWMDELGLSPEAFRLLAHLWRRADASRTCYPSVDGICEKVGFASEKRLQKYVRELEERGLLRRESRIGTTNLWHLLLPEGNQGGGQNNTPLQNKGTLQNDSPVADKTTAGGDTKRHPRGMSKHQPKGSPAEGSPLVDSPLKEPQGAGAPVLSGTQDSGELLLEPSLPVGLDTPNFKAAWIDWLAYRRERRLAAYKPKTITAQLTALAGWGHDGAIESIRASIRQQWQGLFEPKAMGRTATGGPSIHTKAPTTEDHAKGFFHGV